MTSASQIPTSILVIDDDPVLLMGAAAILSKAGYDCHCARDPEAARKATRTVPIDLILCDVNLDGESGLELCRELRSEPGMEDVPVMFVSSSQLPDIVRRSHDAGGAYFLRKPYEPRVLVELVAKALWMPHLVQAQINRLRESPIGKKTEIVAEQPKPISEVTPAHRAVKGVPAPLGMPGVAAQRVSSASNA